MASQTLSLVLLALCPGLAQQTWLFVCLFVCLKMELFCLPLLNPWQSSDPRMKDLIHGGTNILSLLSVLRLCYLFSFH